MITRSPEGTVGHYRILCWSPEGTSGHLENPDGYQRALFWSPEGTVLVIMGS